MMIKTKMNPLEKNLVEIYVAADEIEARHLVELLEEQNINSSIVGAGLIGGAGELPMGWTLSPRIWVEESNHRQARAIIDRWEQDRRADRLRTVAKWRCPKCKADVPANFEICWQCQYSPA